MSRVAMIIAGIYFAVAATIYIAESFSTPTGGFIAWRHMGSFLATFPMPAPSSMIGFEPNFNDRFVVAMIGAPLCRVSH